MAEGSSSSSFSIEGGAIILSIVVVVLVCLFYMMGTGNEIYLLDSYAGDMMRTGNCYPLSCE